MGAPTSSILAETHGHFFVYLRGVMLHKKAQSGFDTKYKYP
jgi:hypothetical protein